MPPKKTAKKAVAKPTNMAALREKLGKRYGDAVVRRENVKSTYDVIPTGSLSLDLALRTGGWVEGRIHEIIGVEGVGKTTRVIESMVEAQRKYPDKAVAYIDMEQTFDYPWAEELGLKTDDDHWLHVFPDDSEDVSDVLRETVATGLFSVVVVDSIGGMESKQAFEKEAEGVVMGRNAQVITRMVKHCAVLCRKYQTTALLVNQYRANISNPMGSDIAAGPKALKYATTTQVAMARTSDEPIMAILPGDKDPVMIGRKIRARVARSKVSVQGKSAEYWLFNADTPEFGPIGTDKADEGVTIGVFTDFFNIRGSWYYFDGEDGKERRFNGRSALLDHLRSCPDDLEWVRSQSIARLAHEVIEETEVTIEQVAQ